MASAEDPLDPLTEAVIKAIDLSPDLKFLVDDTGRIAFANAQAETLTGYGREELLDGTVERLVPEAARPGHARKREGFLVSGEVKAMAKGGPLRLRRKDGGEVPVEISLTPVVAGGRRYTLAIVRDVTARLALENRLAEARRLEALGQMAASLSHELNTPMTFVAQNVRFALGCTQTLTQKLGELASLLSLAAARPSALDQARELLAEVRHDPAGGCSLRELMSCISDADRGAQEATGIANTVRQTAHPGSHTVGPVSVNEVVDTAALLSRGQWKYCATLDLQLAPDVPQVTGVRAALTQAVLNLVVNAAQAISARRAQSGADLPPLGRIAVRSRRVGAFVELSIEDDGPGIPRALQPLVFRPFFTTKDPQVGTGQGLALVKRVVEHDFGGEVSFSSVEGKGCSFTLRLPVAPHLAQA